MKFQCEFKIQMQLLGKRLTVSLIRRRRACLGSEESPLRSSPQLPGSGFRMRQGARITPDSLGKRVKAAIFASIAKYQ